MPVRKPAPGDLEPIETASRDQLASLQLRRLQWSLRHAYDNVAHYRNAFDSAGVTPVDCRTLADLARFPFTVKADLRDNYPFSMFAVPRERVVRVHASSINSGDCRFVRADPVFVRFVGGFRKPKNAAFGGDVARQAPR